MVDTIKLTIFAALVIGYIINVVKIATAAALAPFVILRLVGVVVMPLGGILGWF